MHFFSRFFVPSVLFFVSLFASFPFASNVASAMPLAARCEDLFQTILPLEQSLKASYMAREFSREPDESLNGQVTVRVPVTLESMRMAYARGLYPYGEVQGRDAWFSSPDRGVFDFDKMRIGKSDRAALRKLHEQIADGRLQVTRNQAFAEVVKGCAAQERKQRNAQTGELEDGHGTWMTPAYQKAAIDAFKAGEGYSSEVWRDGQLVAGVYGFLWNGVFHAESMFHTEKEVAKLAFEALIEDAKAMGYTWLDVQVAPPDSKSLSVKWGAYNITRAAFQQRQVEARQQMLRLKRQSEL